jgi:hypothetical protein
MNGREIPPEGWSDEGATWFNELSWPDAQFLLTTRREDPLSEDDRDRLSRLRASYEAATGETWR